MAGGIFPGKPFAWNVKCVVFTAILAGGYWFAPYRNKWVMFLLLWFPYVAMAWYDYQNKIQPTLFPYGRYIFLPFKPNGYKQAFDKLSPEQIKSMDQLDHVTTWVIASGIIGYIFLFRN